ncbi:MAG TPA: pseudouridine-5'-phosphate glycosidase, partial [Solirubrobacteraceae bacterium]|nr:pseudouridine-5'-phosphate glycosidase [Solirubrobacteraceae bacterium]
RAIEEIVREEGAVPATIAVVEGMVRIGLDREALETIAGDDDVVKCSARDLSVVMARRATGATTVAATATLAVRAGISVFATGGLGGVHREARESWDESADLTTLGQTPITVVCAGVKSVLDVEATLERLETLNVTLLGYRTDRFPGFYLTDSGFPVPWRVDTPEEVADVHHARGELGLGAVVVANPIEQPLDAELHEKVLHEALAAAEREGIRGKDITPFLLESFHTQTAGASLQANVRLVLRNAALAAQIARAAA